MTTVSRAGAALLLSGSIAACGSSPAPAAPAVPAATVSNPIAETALTTITLSEAAQHRLGIETGAAERRVVTQTRTLGADVMPAGGAQLTVTAPLAGTLSSELVPPAVGSYVGAGQPVLRLIPLSPADRDVRVEAERVVAEAEGRQVMMEKRAERARALVKDGAGSQRAAEEAEADLAVANAAVQAARARLALAARGVSDTGAIALTAPHAAVLRTLLAAPGQAVSAGAPLFELVRLETVWLRVPLYAGDVETIDVTGPAEMVPLGAAADVRGKKAHPVTAPPAADPTTAGVDVFYSVANVERALRPGQRVSVRLPLRRQAESLVVPYSAILVDAFGGTWLYEAQEGGVFVRHRVVVSDRVGDSAVLQQGPPVGTRVVTVGAAELFGTEFGVGK